MGQTYEGMHSKIRRLRGPAKAHICAAPGCERPATQWALVGEATEFGPAKASNPAPVRWSLDVMDYAPTCRPHNAQLDHGGTWEACPMGHHRTPGVVGACVECGRVRSREHARKRQQRDPIAVREANRAWRAANRERVSAYNRAYRDRVKSSAGA